MYEASVVAIQFIAIDCDGVLSVIQSMAINCGTSRMNQDKMEEVQSTICHPVCGHSL